MERDPLVHDPLVQALALQAREEAAGDDGPYGDPRWQALAAGTLAAPDAAALRSQMEALLGADAAAEAFAAYQPLGDGFEARVADRLRGQRSVARPFEPAAAVETSAPTAKPRRWRDLRPPLWAALAAAGLGAVAIGALLWHLPPPVALPKYNATVTGGVDSLRGPGQPEDATVVAGNQLHLVLRPATAVDRALVARAFLQREGAETGRAVEPWPVAIEVAPTGAVSIRGIVEVRPGPIGEFAASEDTRLPLPPGASTVLVLLAPAGSLPADAELAGVLADLLARRATAASAGGVDAGAGEAGAGPAGDEACTALARYRILCQLRLDVGPQR